MSNTYRNGHWIDQHFDWEMEWEREAEGEGKPLYRYRKPEYYVSSKYRHRDGRGKPDGWEYDYVRPRVSARRHIARSFVEHGMDVPIPLPHPYGKMTGRERAYN